MDSGLRPSSSHNYTLDYVSSNTMIEKDSAGENYMGVPTDTKDLVLMIVNVPWTMVSDQQITEHGQVLPQKNFKNFNTYWFF